MLSPLVLAPFASATAVLEAAAVAVPAVVRLRRRRRYATQRQCKRDCSKQQMKLLHDPLLSGDSPNQREHGNNGPGRAFFHAPRQQRTVGL